MNSLSDQLPYAGGILNCIGFIFLACSYSLNSTFSRISIFWIY